MAQAPFSRTERDALCDLALELGEDAPTLCGGWDAKDLVVHLLVRERSLLAAPGVVVPALRFLTERETARYAREDFPALVDRLRSVWFTPLAIPVVDRLVNTVEFFVHHEDLRRAQPDWQPRDLSRREQSMLWSGLRVMGPRIARQAGLPTSLTLRRTDKAAEFDVAPGEDPVVVSGPPAELLLFLLGRSQTTGLEFSGSEDAVAAVREASFSL
jgi:uncharacterized protein (TIGR03085 family)